LFGTPQRLKSLSGLRSFNAAGTDIKLSGKVLFIVISTFLMTT